MKLQDLSEDSLKIKIAGTVETISGNELKIYKQGLTSDTDKCPYTFPSRNGNLWYAGKIAKSKSKLSTALKSLPK